jgi:cob(I)alamin adenosyltransferase
MSKLYTGKGDDGTTGLLFGGRVPKDDPRPDAYGAVDEAQAAIGLARAAAERGSELDGWLVGAERDLYVLMAELATAPENQHKLVPGQSAVTTDMVSSLGRRTDDVGGRFPFPTEFVIPGQTELAARLDVARTVVRRAERASVGVAVAGSHVVPYLNRLSSLLWTLARWVEADDTLLSRTASRTTED